MAEKKSRTTVRNKKNLLQLILDEADMAVVQKWADDEGLTTTAFTRVVILRHVGLLPPSKL